LRNYRQICFLTDVPIKGYYRFNDWFQICPPPDNAPHPPFNIGQHPIILEFTYSPTDKPRVLEDGSELPIDLMNTEISNGVAKEISLLLSTLTLYRIFILNQDESWFKILDDNSTDIHWGIRLYRINHFNGFIDYFSDMGSKMEIIDTLKYYSRDSRSLSQVFDLPSDLSKYLNIYCKLESDAKHHFLAACTLFCQAYEMATIFPSVSFAIIVTALETLISYDAKDDKVEFCPSCGQKKYRVIGKFKEFFSKYGLSNKEFTDFAKKVYNYRSGLLHRGELMFGETSVNKFGVFEHSEAYFTRLNLIRFARFLIVNWLANKKDS